MQAHFPSQPETGLLKFESDDEKSSTLHRLKQEISVMCILLFLTRIIMTFAENVGSATNCQHF